MEKFNLEAHLASIYSSHPESTHRPVVGITTNIEGTDATLRSVYYEQVVAAGAVPVLIPPVTDSDVIASTLDRIDALVLTGGGDFNPLWAGEQPSTALHSINSARDLPELLITRLAYNRCVPMLGICRGIQTLAMALGGHVDQDIYSHDSKLIKHSQDADRSESTHTVTLLPDTIISRIYGGAEQICVNSFHHQAVDQAGPHMRITATAPDGTPEAIESSEHKPILGVQWHPEWMAEEGRKIFEWLTGEARIFAQTKQLHARHIVLDSHCDTPMFFPQGVDFGTRDNRILVDLHKMDDGRQDVVTMVAYLEQPKPGVKYADIAPFPVAGPREYADLIFDKIQQIVDAHPDHLALARNLAEVIDNKNHRRHTIMLGIENGQAIDHSLQNLDHFAARGIVYMTLCHNGDNDICDSARGTATWGGVSPFGREVIKRMNELGVMVDLSHGAESSFYDALDISTQPIVCSHSSCRALCDHPRNLTDDQMRRLAAKGGVMQVTAYPGFLQINGEADILHLMLHLDHAVEVMGIEHVGLGTDFDGDGGIPGMADSSDLLNFTRHLLLHRYSEEDISRILGGNWLRVMAQVQNGAIMPNDK